MTDLFIIEMRFTAAVHMNQFGDWGDWSRARLFDSEGHAQAFLDTKTRRMKKGMRERVRIVPVSAEDLRDMQEGAAEALAAARKHGTLQDVMAWSGHFTRLSDLIWDRAQ